MLKKRVLKRLLPLLFSFCFVFSGFLSVNVFAYEKEYLSYPYGYPEIEDANVYWGTNLTELYNRQNVLGNRYDNLYVQIWSSGVATDWSSFFVGDSLLSTVYPFDNERYTYKVVGHFYVDGNNNNFNINSLDISDIKIHEYQPFNSNTVSKSVSNLIVNTNYTFDTVNFNFTFDLLEYSNLSVLEFVFNEPLKFTNRNNSAIGFTASVVAVPKDTTEDELNAIISAINNQTTTLDGSIGQAADDIQQSIEDQYSGEPDEEFSVEDVITQHNEKMGVLSFGSDVMLQFLDMFQSANVGIAELTLPGFNIIVENVEYSVWPDYSFNFEQLNEWVPALMSVIRVMLPAFVWLMVLRYCIKVFEDNFLAK